MFIDYIPMDIPMDYLFDPLHGATHANFDGASFYYTRCSSTNDMAKKMLPHVAEGTVFIAEYQYKGRGQRGSTWTSEAGKNLLFSLILSPEWLTIGAVFSLNVISSLAIYDVLVDALPKGLSVKWPNDIYYLDKKLGGMLIETNIGERHKINTAIIGIGLNVNQLHFEVANCTSLAIQKGSSFDRALLLTDIMDALSSYYAQLQNGIGNLLWEKYSNILYRNTGFHWFQTIYGALEGRIIGVNRLGNLVIAARNGQEYSYKPKEIVFI